MERTGDCDKCCITSYATYSCPHFLSLTREKKKKKHEHNAFYVNCEHSVLPRNDLNIYDWYNEKPVLIECHFLFNTEMGKKLEAYILITNKETIRKTYLKLC